MKIPAAVCLFAFLTLSVPQVMAGDRELAGALIGAGTGAVIGHVIGGNTESALIGSAIGGIVGLSAGHSRIWVSPGTSYDRPRHHYFSRDKHHRRYFSHGVRSCRIEKYITYRHGQKILVKERICRGDSPYRHHRYQHPYGNRGYKYHGYGDWRNKHYDWRR